MSDDVFTTDAPDAMASVQRLTKDLRTAARVLGPTEARYLVDAYYIMQDDRKRSKMQSDALDKAGEPNEVIQWLFAQSKSLENQIKVSLDVYTQNHMMGSWMRGVYGIGPVISAGLLAHIDITKAPTVGHIWQYAGIAGSIAKPDDRRAIYRVTFDKPVDPNNPPQLPLSDNREAVAYYPDGENVFVYGIEVGDKEAPAAALDNATVEMSYRINGQKPWEKGKKRPFNAGLKTLCWKAGQSFMKFSNAEECFYGKIYRDRKQYEIDRNESGGNAAYAATRVTTVGAHTEARKYYEDGKCPPGQIDGRARRYAVKLFLAHMHGEWHQRHFGKPAPLPYPIAHLGHVHMIAAPH